MAQPVALEITGHLACEPLFLMEETGQPICVVVAKGTYSINGGGIVSPAKAQDPVTLAGEYWSDSVSSSYKYEPECAFTKLSTDVVLIGHACAPNTHTYSMLVTCTVGKLSRQVLVFGNRFWYNSVLGVRHTSPETFETVPLIYERAFGGWDRTNPDPTRHTFEHRNPVGVGFRIRSSPIGEKVPLPNLEDPKDLISYYGQIVSPVGFGFVSGNWLPRAQYAGTYDGAWERERMPLLPLDFDRRFFNAASPGLVASGYLNGDESVNITGTTAGDALSFALPGTPPPRCTVQLQNQSDVVVQPSLDTVIINADERKLHLVWRGYVPLRNGPNDVTSIRVEQ